MWPVLNNPAITTGLPLSLELLGGVSNTVEHEDTAKDESTSNGLIILREQY